MGKWFEQIVQKKILRNKEIVIYAYNGIVLSGKWEGTTDTCNIMMNLTYFMLNESIPTEKAAYCIIPYVQHTCRTRRAENRPVAGYREGVYSKESLGILGFWWKVLCCEYDGDKTTLYISPNL